MTETNILKTARDEGIELTNGEARIFWKVNAESFMYVETGRLVPQRDLTYYHWTIYTPPKSTQEELEEAWRKWTCVAEDVDGSKLNILLACFMERLRELER